MDQVGVTVVMIPMGYMAKRVVPLPEVMKFPGVKDIYSVSNCVNDDFFNYTDSWRHNGYWVFDRPEIIVELSKENQVDLAVTTLFFYEVYEQEFVYDVGRKCGVWRKTSPDRHGTPVNVKVPDSKRLEGFDIVTVWVENSPDMEHSPLSCNGIAEDVSVNEHCLIETLEAAKAAIDEGMFHGGEPGALRIVAVYTVEWPAEAGGAP